MNAFRPATARAPFEPSVRPHPARTPCTAAQPANYIAPQARADHSRPACSPQLEPRRPLGSPAHFESDMDQKEARRAVRRIAIRPPTQFLDSELVFLPKPDS